MHCLSFFENCPCSIAWIVHELAELVTWVRIPARACFSLVRGLGFVVDRNDDSESQCEEKKSVRELNQGSAEQFQKVRNLEDLQ